MSPSGKFEKSMRVNFLKGFGKRFDMRSRRELGRDSEGNLE
jgi:hypothetical protein